MRPRFSPAVLAMISVWTLAIQSPAASAARPKTTHYSGRIGKSLEIEMRLTEEPIMETNNGESYQRGVRYSGSYSYSKEGRPIRVTGVYDALGTGGAVEHPRIELREETDGKWTGYFDGAFGRGGVYSGNWYSADGKRKLPFILYPKRAK